MVVLPRYSDEYLLNELKRVYEILGRTPTCDELKKYGAPNKTTYTNRFKNYARACELAGIPPIRARKDLNDDELLDIIREVYKQKKRPLTVNDFDKVPGLPSRSMIEKRFGGFCRACYMAGVPSVKHYKIDKDEMLEMLKNLYKKLGRAPHSDELVENGLPSCPTYRFYFGSYTKALLLAGVEETIHSYGNYRGIKCLAKDGTLCASLGELKITNFLIDNGVKFEKEPKYPNSNYRADWKINNTLVEFFGLIGNEKYDRKIKIKREICKREGLKLIEIYPKDLDNLNEVLKDVI
jgi:hypothetical protein